MGGDRDAESQLVAPVLVLGVAAGAIELRGAPDPRGFTPGDIELVVELAHVAGAAVEAYRGERLLSAMFAAVLPGAMSAGTDLAAELGRWIDEVRATPGFRRELALVARLRAVARDDAGLRLVEELVDAVLRAEAARRFT
jgi:GAF domain-containing protein